MYFSDGKRLLVVFCRSEVPHRAVARSPSPVLVFVVFRCCFFPLVLICVDPRGCPASDEWRGRRIIVKGRVHARVRVSCGWMLSRMGLHQLPPVFLVPWGASCVEKWPREGGWRVCVRTCTAEFIGW